MSDNWPGTAVGTENWPGKPVNASTPQEKPAPTMLDEAVKQKQQEAVSGFKRGIAGGIGLPGDITKYLGTKLGLKDVDRALPTSEEVATGMEKLGIEKPKGKSDKVIEFLSNPLSYLGGGSVLSKILGAGGAGVGADVGERVGGTPGEIIGGVTGGLLPHALPGIGKAVGPSLGMNTPANREAAANYLESEGVQVSAGQQTGSTPLRTAESQLGQAFLSGDVAKEGFGRQMRQYTKAALKRVGENADEATSDVVDRAFTRIGKDFDRLQTNSIIPDQQFKNEIAQAYQDYANKTSLSTHVDYARNVADSVAKIQPQTVVSGDAYKAFRSELNKLMRGTKDPEYKAVLREYQNAVDDAMERTLAQTNPKELGKFREARRQYRNMMVIEKAATRAGEAAREGLITPQSLRAALVGQSRRDFARGRGDFAKLAQAGEMLLTAPKSSGTAERGAMHAVPALLAGAGGAAASGNIPAALAAALGASAPGLTGRALHSKAIQDILKGKRRLPSSAYGVRALLNVLGDRNAVGQ